MSEIITLDTLELPDDLFWVDEYDWCEIVQSESERNVDGTIDIDQGVKIGGRPITLEGSEERGWVTKEKLDELAALSNTPEKVMTLTMPDEREFQVMFRHSDGKPISAKPIWQESIMEAEDKYWIVLRLMEVVV